MVAGDEVAEDEEAEDEEAEDGVAEMVAMGNLVWMVVVVVELLMVVADVEVEA